MLQTTQMRQLQTLVQLQDPDVKPYPDATDLSPDPPPRVSAACGQRIPKPAERSRLEVTNDGFMV
jgi:hypothetical protein